MKNGISEPSSGCEQSSVKSWVRLGKKRLEIVENERRKHTVWLATRCLEYESYHEKTWLD